MGQPYVFTAKMRTVTEHYTSDVRVYDDRISISRSGRSSLPADSTVFFRDASAVSWGEAAGRSWISVTVPGVLTTNNVVKSTIQAGIFTVNGPSIPYQDPFSIIFGLHESADARRHYRAIKERFDRFKETAHDAQTPTTTVYQESVMDKLKKLKELKELGIVSEEEYEEKRKKLLTEV